MTKAIRSKSTKLKNVFSREIEYAIREEFKNGHRYLLPMVKEVGFFGVWRPIVKIYDEYLILDFEKEGGFSREECLQHIQGFKQQQEMLEVRNHRALKYSKIDVSVNAVSDNSGGGGASLF